MLYRPNINLLPDDKKTRLKTLVKFIFARDLLELSLLFYCLLAIIFIWSWLTLVTEYTNTALGTTLVNRESSARSREVRETNNLVRQFNRSAENYAPISPKLSELIATFPADIKFNSLTFDRTKNSLVISGTARTRTALLAYESIIRKLSWAKNITSPIAQLLEKENINFEIKAELINDNGLN